MSFSKEYNLDVYKAYDELEKKLESESKVLTTKDRPNKINARIIGEDGKEINIQLLLSSTGFDKVLIHLNLNMWINNFPDLIYILLPIIVFIFPALYFTGEHLFTYLVLTIIIAIIIQIIWIKRLNKSFREKHAKYEKYMVDKLLKGLE